MSSLTDIATLSRAQLIELIKNKENEITILRNHIEMANQANSQFSIFSIHELRTPLTSIIGLIHLLEQPNLNTNDTKKAIDSIKKCTLYLLDIVQNMLYLS